MPLALIQEFNSTFTNASWAHKRRNYATAVAEDTEGLKAVPTHNGHGSLGPDGREPAWFLLGLKPVRVPLVPPASPPAGTLHDRGLTDPVRRGIVFKLKGAAIPGIPYDSDWRSWIFDAMEDPVLPALPLIRPGANDKKVLIHLHWPGYPLSNTYKFRAYLPKESMSITRIGLVDKIFSRLEQLSERCVSHDNSRKASKGYSQQLVQGFRSWQLAPLGPQAQRDGHVTLDCLWLVGLKHCWDNVFVVELMLAEQNAPPHFGRPHYSQIFVKPSTVEQPKDDKDENVTCMDDLYLNPRLAT